MPIGGAREDFKEKENVEDITARRDFERGEVEDLGVA